jgi:hypothetical protein
MPTPDVIPLPLSPHYRAARPCSPLRVENGQWTGGQCCVCGAATRHPRMLHLIDGGANVALPGSQADRHPDPAADLGLQCVGSECLKRFPHLKPYVFRLPVPNGATP